MRHPIDNYKNWQPKYARYTKEDEVNLNDLESSE